ncbi:MAG TPA: DUF2121 domain-containing protein [Methanothermococcus okinawensis]|uniref:DUF2121 domain-containing protein n=1 Tax=Methanothermococcus okinawensis TaxID=155863 RepID=A0A833E112_9EURY|nr:DUF2121 domain-containing protein [Methanothermococcus okinawensis]HIP90969.1 DUF2121 domain-containing protein [Methanothermococcus okinawensis]
MSIIIGYYGNNGAVIGGDRRNIIFRGDPKKREELERRLYSGEIKDEEELKRVAEELGVKVYIEDERIKVKRINNTLVGEVRSIGADSRRRRMYLTKGIGAIVDIINDDIVNKSVKRGSGIIIFGNKHLKEIASKELKKYMYNFNRMSIEEVKKVIEDVLRRCCKGPTSSRDFDVLYIDRREEDLEKVIERDLEELKRYREELRQKMIDFKKVMAIVNKIENRGEVGVIKDGKLVLNGDHLAIDKVCPNPKQFKEIEVEGDFEEGDTVVIEDGTLKVKGKDVELKTKYIICRK